MQSEYWSIVIPYPEYEISTLNRFRSSSTKELLIPVDNSNLTRRVESWSVAKLDPRYEVSSKDRVRIKSTGEILLDSNNCTVRKLKNTGSVYRTRTGTGIHRSNAVIKRIEERKLSIIHSTKPNTEEQRNSPEQPYIFTTSKRDKILASIEPLSSLERNEMIRSRILSIIASILLIIGNVYFIIWSIGWVIGWANGLFSLVLAGLFIMIFVFYPLIIIKVRIDKIWFCLKKPLERWNDLKSNIFA